MLISFAKKREAHKANERIIELRFPLQHYLHNGTTANLSKSALGLFAQNDLCSFSFSQFLTQQINSTAPAADCLSLYSFCVIKSQPRYKLLYTQKYFNLMPSYLFVFIILNCFLYLLVCLSPSVLFLSLPFAFSFVLAFVYNFLLCYPRKFHRL